MKPMSSPHTFSIQRLDTKVGSVTLKRSIKSSVSGETVTIEVVTAHRGKLIRETSNQIRALVQTPISAEQKQKAQWLAKRAKEAKCSAFTAKLRKTA